MKRSALYQIQQRAGASFVPHQGWEVADTFGGAEQELAAVRSGAGLADQSWITKLDLKAVRGTLAAGSAGRPWQLGPQRYLLTCAPDEREQVLSTLPLASSTDVTSVYAAMLLAGPRSRQVMRKLSSLNVSEAALPDGGCAQAGVAHVHTTVLRRDLDGLPGFRLLVSRDYAESVWESVMHAGHEFHIVPFGLQAMRQLGA